MTAAVVRVKRCQNDDPVEALLVSCKRLKGADGQAAATVTAEDIKEVFKFVGTVAKQGDNLPKHIKDNITKTRPHAKKQAKPLPSKRHEQNRDAFRVAQRAGRYKVLASHRDIDVVLEREEKEGAAKNGPKVAEGGGKNGPKVADGGEVEAGQLFGVFDAVEGTSKEDEERKKKRAERKMQELSDPDAITCNSVRMIRELTLSDGPAAPQQSPQFVYDIYYSDSLDPTHLQHIVEVTDCHQMELVHEDADDEGGDMYDDEDDSNDESNWRNDYPDENEESSRDIDYYDPDYEWKDTFGDLSSDDDDYLGPRRMPGSVKGAESAAMARFKAHPLADLDDGYCYTVQDGGSDSDKGGDFTY
ncbi:probable RNA polymerase II nuclear localization protein SLC7A6OS [Branchiostoma lanceolatum]|uniref:probable RNA polymerase II nuclear localization protein SLC7A6OS n=1 Tax=Branchiostoma lanceolatum TaxID=7740 RepID=UPI003453315E